MRIESYLTFAVCHKISRIKLFIGGLEVNGSSINISMSDLVESLAEAFAVDDKQDNYVQQEFEVFTFSIVNFEFLLI